MTLTSLPTIACTLLGTLNASEKEATVLCLHGDLGAGKTTLTQEIARQLGVAESLTSPTFVIMKNYKTKDKKFIYLVHIDAYRLKKSEELVRLDWNNVVKERQTLIILEWPENVPDCIPKNAYHVNLSHVNTETRSIEF